MTIDWIAALPTDELVLMHGGLADLTKYSPDQERDERGRFAGGGDDRPPAVIPSPLAHGGDWSGITGSDAGAGFTPADAERARQEAIDKTPPYDTANRYSPEELLRGTGRRANIAGADDHDKQIAEGKVIATAMNIWRGSFEGSSNLRAMAEGRDAAPAYQRDASMRFYAYALRDAVAAAPPLGSDSWRIVAGYPPAEGERVSFALAATAADRAQAEGYGTSLVVNDSTLFHFPADTQGLWYEGSPREAIVGGAFTVASVERDEGHSGNHYVVELARAATKGEGHDVSGEARDEGGRWTDGGGSMGETQPRMFSDVHEATQWARGHFIYEPANGKNGPGWWNTLNDTQLRAAGFYSTFKYQVMNGILRTGEPPKELLLPQWLSVGVDHPVDEAMARQGRDLIPVLRDMIDTAPPLGEPLTVYRQFDATQFGDIKPGDVISDKAFVSVATFRDTAQMAMPLTTAVGDAEIVLPAGTRAAMISDAAELVLQAGSRFRVDAVDPYEGGSAAFRFTYLGAGASKGMGIPVGTGSSDGRFFWGAGDVTVTRAAVRKYNEDQPREPAGSPEGGRWAGGDETLGSESGRRTLNGLLDRFPGPGGNPIAHVVERTFSDPTVQGQTIEPNPTSLKLAGRVLSTIEIDRKVIEENTWRSAQRGWDSPRIPKTTATVVTHEFGHAVENMIYGQGGPTQRLWPIEVKRDWDSAMREIYVHPTSGYARAMGGERFAEAFSAAYSPGTKAADEPGPRALREFMDAHWGDVTAAWEQSMAWAKVLKYSEDEARDDHGRWTDGEGGVKEAYEKNLAELRGHAIKFISARVEAAGIPTRYFGQCNRAMYAEAAAMLLALHERFPTVRVGVLSMDSNRYASNRGGQAAAYTKQVYGGRSEIVLATEFFGKNARFDLANSPAGWVHDGSPAGIMAHEFGHAVDHAALDAQSRMDAVVAATPEGWRNNAFIDVPAISKYGETEPQEKFAELFAATYMGDAPAGQEAALRAYLTATIGADSAKAELLKYNEDQAREPAGSPEGGRFAGGGEAKDPADWTSKDDARAWFAQSLPDTKIATDEKLIARFRPDDAARLRAQGDVIGKMHLEHVRQLAQAIARVQATYPQVGLRITSISIRNMGRREYASWTGARNVGMMTISPRTAMQPNALSKSLASDVASGWHPPGCGTFQSVVEHELGHGVGNWLGSRGGFQPGTVRMGDETFHIGRGNPSPGKDGVGLYNSTYALENGAEWFAEQFAGALAAGEPLGGQNNWGFVRAPAGKIEKEYNPDQPRDERGRWAGGVSDDVPTTPRPEKIPSGAPLPEFIARTHANMALVDARVEQLAAHYRAASWPARGGGSLIVSMNMTRSRPEAEWRVTRIGDDGEPWGHYEELTFQDAVRSIWQDGSADIFDPPTEAVKKGELGDLLRKYSDDQPRDDHGRWSDGGGGLDATAAELAHGGSPSIHAGQVGAFLDACAQRDDNPNLSNLMVDGRPLLGNENLGMTRDQMPQLPREDRVAFLADLEASGVRVAREETDPKTLHSIQAEVSGRASGLMLQTFRETGITKPPMVSADNYVIDGHHTWAAGLGLAYERPGYEMPVIRVGLDHDELLRQTWAYADAHGIEIRPMGVTSDRSAVGKMSTGELLELAGELDMVWKYSPDQERDDHGRWTSGAALDEAIASYTAAHPETVVDLAGGKSRELAEALTQLGRLQDRFPQFVVGRIAVEWFPRYDGGTIAETKTDYEDGAHILLNAAWWMKDGYRVDDYGDAITTRLYGSRPDEPGAHSVAGRWLAVPDPAGVITHEFGHVADTVTNWVGDRSAILTAGQPGGRGSYTYISGYAGSSNVSNENFAEVFAAAYAPGSRLTDDPRAVAMRAYFDGATKGYSEDEPRDEGGRWTSGGGDSIDRYREERDREGRAAYERNRREWEGDHPTRPIGGGLAMRYVVPGARFWHATNERDFTPSATVSHVQGGGYRAGGPGGLYATSDLNYWAHGWVDDRRYAVEVEVLPSHPIGDPPQREHMESPEVYLDPDHVAVTRVCRLADAITETTGYRGDKWIGRDYVAPDIRSKKGVAGMSTADLLALRADLIKTDFFTDATGVHPIRDSEGYDPGVAGEGMVGSQIRANREEAEAQRRQDAENEATRIRVLKDWTHDAYASAGVRVREGDRTFARGDKVYLTDGTYAIVEKVPAPRSGDGFVQVLLGGKPEAYYTVPERDVHHAGTWDTPTGWVAAGITPDKASPPDYEKGPLMAREVMSAHDGSGRTYSIQYDATVAPDDPAVGKLRDALHVAVADNRQMESDTGVKNAWNGNIILGGIDESQWKMGGSTAAVKEWSCDIRLADGWFSRNANMGSSDEQVLIHELAHGISATASGGGAVDSYRFIPGHEEGVVEAYTQAFMAERQFGPNGFATGMAGASYKEWVGALNDARANIVLNTPDSAGYLPRLGNDTLGAQLSWYRDLLTTPLSSRPGKLDSALSPSGFSLWLMGDGRGTRSGSLAPIYGRPPTTKAERQPMMTVAEANEALRRAAAHLKDHPEDWDTVGRDSEVYWLISTAARKVEKSAESCNPDEPRNELGRWTSDGDSAVAPDPEQLRSGLASWVGHLVDDGMNQPLTLSEGARALSIAGESFFGEEQEWVTAGRFRVDMVTRDYGYQDGKWGPGGYTVHLTQLDTFAHPSEAIGSKSLVPELTKAGPTVRLASGGKRRDASLNPIVARTKAALRALAAEHKATPNPLVLSDRAKTLLYSAYLESMDAGYDDSGADREYWDEGDAEETADEKSNGMLPWLIGLGALLMAGGLSDAMLDSRMGQYSATLNPVYEQGFAQGAGAQGTITSVTWHTEEDETVCALCDERDGQVWYGDEEHPYPGDGGYGGEVCDGGPNCFPGDTLVAGQITGAFRMRYSGPVCDLVTASGRALTVTPNHPILTTRGWVRAGMLHEGDEVFSETVSVGDRARDHAHDDPATADEVFDLLAEASAVRARLQTRPGDFYGDAIGGDGHVDVVGADSVLRHGINPASDEGGRQAVLKLAAMQPASLTGDGSTLNAVARITTPTAGDPGGAEEADGVLSLPADVHRLGAISQVDTVATEQPFDSPTSGTDLAAEISRGFPRLVATDKVVHNHVRQFEGHVYDLQTSIGWHTANGIITSNCRCELWYDIVPASETDGGEIGALGALAAGAAAAAFAMDEAGTPDVTDFSDWARVSEDPSEDIGGDLSAVATGTLMKIAAFLAKYNEDQPRDERGRFAGGGVDVGDFARRVRERFGTTQDIQRASFLLPDGTLLARAGTAREGLAGYLYHHTEVIDEVYGDRPEASRPTVNDVMQAGVVRLNARWGGWVDAEMGMRPLTQPQMDVLREAGEAGPHFVLQVSRPGESDGGYSDAAYVGSDFEAATPIYQMLREANAAASGQVVRFTASHDEILRKYSLDQAREPASATKGEGHDVSDEPRDEGGRWTSGGGDSVPVEPGTLPLAPGEIRAYHYTNSIEALHSILKEGLSVGHARGHAYGEPDTLWLSAKMPDPSTHAFIEVHLRPEELNIGGPWAGEHWDQSQIDTFMARGSNFTLAASELAPDRIVTYSEPWHDTYRYMMSEWPPETATADRIAEIKSVATYDDDTAKAAARWLAQVPSEKILKSNPYHDEAGRFTTADGAAGAAEATDPHEKAWEAVGARLDALGKGNCYPAAATIALRAEELGLKNAVVCQGTVTPDHGPLKGVSFGHAWVEADLAGRQNTIRIAYDYSSGNRVSLPASYYRDLGSATDVHEYSREKALALVVGQGHYGPWE